MVGATNSRREFFSSTTNSRREFFSSATNSRREFFSLIGSASHCSLTDFLIDFNCWFLLSELFNISARVVATSADLSDRRWPGSLT